jgi:type II secretory pathway pseudopilin PulG
MFGRLKKINKNQKGITLIELIMVIAITALIIGVIVMSISLLLNVSARSDNHMLAVRQVQNAGYWISRDVQMAQSVVTDEGSTGFPLDVAWKDWDTNLHEITYNLLGNGELKRSYSVNGGGASETLIAQYIESIEVAPRPFTGDKLTLTVTAAVGGWPKVENETRVYEIVPRPD